jgi:hypothetical protein
MVCTEIAIRMRFAAGISLNILDIRPPSLQRGGEIAAGAHGP